MAPRSLALAVLAGIASQAAAQQSDCGTVLTPADAAQLSAAQRAGLYSLPLPAQDVPIWIGLTFHVCRQSNGTGGISQAQLDQAVIDANAAFAAAGIQFCQAGPTRFINSDTYAVIDSTAEANAVRQIDVVQGTINCYFAVTGLFCGISSFTTSSVQGIVYANSCVGVSSNHSTFPHEIGHYFDLYHTHETAFGTECTNGSNCGGAGDLVCDTPADPNVLGAVSASCQWTGSATPPCGGSPPYTPPVRNYMSYSNKDCRDQFTALQNARAYSTLVNLRTELARNLCAPSCYPNCDGSTAAPALNVGDFTCFLQKYAAGEAFANCDGSTAQPVLNVADFTCFLQKYAAGCP
jgi:hypothetical protein